VQVAPHDPQLAESVFVSTQLPLQNVWPAAQVQTPFWHERPPLQTWHIAPFAPHCWLLLPA